MTGATTVVDRRGRVIPVLAWESGTRSAAEGRDLAAACRALTRDQLDHWLTVFERAPLFHEAGVIRAEIDRRDPHRKRGTLWEGLGDDTLSARA